MSNSLTTAGSAVIHQLIVAERAADSIVHDTAALNMSLIEARRIAKLRAEQGQGALTDIAEAHQLAVRARFHLVRAHARLAKEAASLGFDWSMFGDESDTPPPSKFADADHAGTEPITA